MDPQLSGFALGLLLGAAKIGMIGTIGFAIAWWRGRKRLAVLEATLPEPGRIEERLAALEQTADFSASQLHRLVEGQAALLRQLPAAARATPVDAELPERTPPGVNTPH